MLAMGTWQSIIDRNSATNAFHLVPENVLINFGTGPHFLQSDVIR